MQKTEAHKHFFLGENKQWFPDEEFIVHMADPRCFIRFRQDLAMFATFDNFYQSIAEVQWIDGRPSDSDVFRVLREAWNFLSIEEQILENDIDAIDDDDEY